MTAALRNLFTRLMAPHEEGDDLAGLDRGDDFTPTEDEADDRGDDVKVTEDDEASTVDDSSDEVEQESDESEEAGAENEEQPRDDQGRFAKKEEPRIPKSRFDEAVSKERAAREAAEARLREIEAQQAAVRRTEDTQKLDNQIAELEKAHGQYLIDGDAEKAAQAAAEIRRIERQIHIAESESMSSTAKEQAREEIRMELTIERLESEYPALNPDAEEHDEALVDFVLAKQQALIQRERMSPSKALARAAIEVMERFGAQAKAEEAVEEAKETKGLNQKVVDRKEAQVKKNVDAARRQPASTKDVGMDSDKAGEKALPDVSKMSYDEFEALPESTKAKLRGDYIG